MLQSQITKLYNQLNSNIQQLTMKRVLENGKNIIIVLCEKKDSIVGIAMMATYKVI